MQPDFYQYEKQNKFNFFNTKSWAFSATSSEGKVALAHPAGRPRDAKAEQHERTSVHRLRPAKITVREQQHQGQNTAATRFYLLTRLPLKFLSLSPLCQTYKELRGKN